MKSRGMDLGKEFCDLYLLLFWDFVNRMSINMITAVSSSRIMTPHTIPTIIIVLSESLGCFGIRLGPSVSFLGGFSLSVEVLSVATEAVEVDDNSLPVAPLEKVALSSSDSSENNSMHVIIDMKPYTQA